MSRKFKVASSAKMDEGGKKAVRLPVTAKNPSDAVYQGHPQLLPEVIWGVTYKPEHSTMKTSYFEVETPSGKHKVSVEEIFD